MGSLRDGVCHAERYSLDSCFDFLSNLHIGYLIVLYPQRI